MRVAERFLSALIPLVAFIAADARAAPPRRIALKKPAFSKRLGREYCSRLFEKDWVSAVGSITEAVPKNGFRVGIGSKMEVLVDGSKKAEGVFLGRLVDTEFNNVDFMFKDYEGKKNYLIDSKRCEIRMNGEKVAFHELQSLSTTVMQQGETCAVYSVTNFFTQLLQSGREGNGLLRKALETPEGYLALQEEAFAYYTKTRGGANFEPILKTLGKKYGYLCHSLELVTPEYLEKTVDRVLGAGAPAIIEFYIGNPMKTADFQWIDTELKVGEDRRFWAPRGVGEKNVGGHALVAVETFESPSGRRKLLLKDSDWMKRPVEWDYDKYFAKRIKSSGMIAHYCENAK